MLCRLCTVDCGDAAIKLFDDNGLKSEIYDVVLKYFEDQLKNMENVKDELILADTKTTSDSTSTKRVICRSCWLRINDFHQWQVKVIAALEQLEKYSKSKQQDVFDSVKLEAEVDVDSLNMIFEPLVVLNGEGNSVAPEDPEQDPVGIYEPKLEETLKSIDALKETTDDESEENYKSSRLRKRIVKAESLTSAKESHNLIKVRKKNLGKLYKIKGKNAKRALAHTEGELTKEQHPKLFKTQEYDTFIANYFKEQLPCELCGELSSNFSDLHDHFRAAHKTEHGYVVCCQHKYSQRFHLVEHLRLHLNPQSYQCNECGKCCANRRNLEIHIKSQHGEQLESQIQCEICQKRFARKGTLKSHMELHSQASKDFICKDCGKGFASENRLNIHKRNVHSTENQSVCEQCGKSFRGRYALKYHLLEHTDAGKRKWPCETCSAQLNSKASLLRHIRVSHTELNSSCICSECGKVAPHEDALRSHRRYMHLQERKYKCNICEKAFKTALSLKEHTTTHTGEYLYQCPHCPRTFKVGSNMYQHRKRKHPKEWAENKKRPSKQGKINLSTTSNY